MSSHKLNKSLIIQQHTFIMMSDLQSRSYGFDFWPWRYCVSILHTLMSNTLEAIEISAV